MTTTMAAPELLTHPRIGTEDALLTRTFSLALQGQPTERATAELIGLAGGDPHRLGRVRDHFAALARRYPASDHVDRALVLATHSWIAAIAER